MTRFLILCAIYWQSAMHGVDPQLVTAMVAVESQFDPAAVAGNCRGILQVDCRVWGRVLNIDKERMTTDVNYALCKGLCVLRYYYNLRHGDIEKALNLYGNGYKYKSDYVGKVRRAYKKLYGRASCLTW
jgi:hypothetical protein